MFPVEITISNERMAFKRQFVSQFREQRRREGEIEIHGVHQVHFIRENDRCYSNFYYIFKAYHKKI